MLVRRDRLLTDQAGSGRGGPGGLVCWTERTRRSSLLNATRQANEAEQGDKVDCYVTRPDGSSSYQSVHIVRPVPSPTNRLTGRLTSLIPIEKHRLATYHK